MGKRAQEWLDVVALVLAVTLVVLCIVAGDLDRASLWGLIAIASARIVLFDVAGKGR